MHAEGRHDPFLTCSFDDGRSITLAENGAGTDWIEDGVTSPATNYADRRGDGAQIVTIVVWRDNGLQRLDVYAPLTPPSGDAPHPAPLAALLSRTAVGGAAMTLATVPGTCTEVNG